MKKFFFICLAIIGWLNSQAQSLPTPEKYNDYIEQVYQLTLADQQKAEFLMSTTMDALSQDPKTYRQMMDLAERRFSDAADLIHNEGLYMTVLKHASENFVLSGAEREKQRLLLEGAKKNMEGSEAIDFDYVTPKDKTVHHLKDHKADYILIYFNNPDCSSCEAVKERLANNELINQMVNDKSLVVLAIYPYNDKKLWSNTRYPSMMINGWNQSQQIEYAELYDLPTLPCFYLLDKNYTVLMKNEGSLNKVEAMLKKLTAPAAVSPSPNLAAKLAAAKDTTAAAPKPSPIAKPKPQKPSTRPAPADDPLVASSESLLGYIIENKYQEIYDNMSDIVKTKASPQTFDGAFAQVESVQGKYLSHEAWEIQEMPNMTAYTSVLHFEKGDMKIFFILEEDGKIKGMNMMPLMPPTKP